MGDKRFRDNFYNTSEQELRFTKEDRNEVFAKIHTLEEQNNIQKKSLFSSSTKFAPLTVSLLVVGLCIFLFMPSFFSENLNTENNSSDVGGTLLQEDEILTTLFTVKDVSNRIHVNLLFTYNKDEKKINLLSIPRDTYAPIMDNNTGSTSYDKLTMAYVNGSGGAENVRNTVSKLFDLSIDYYAVVDLETFSTLIESVNGIDYDLPEAIRVRAISTVAFEFKKGINHLNGEEIVALMMAASEGKRYEFEEENLLNLIHAVLNKAKNEIPPTQFKELTSSIEGNIAIDHLLENEVEIDSIKLLSLKDGMRDDMKDGKYYLMFEKDFLNSISEKLTTFN